MTQQDPTLHGARCLLSHRLAHGVSLVAARYGALQNALSAQHTAHLAEPCSLIQLLLVTSACARTAGLQETSNHAEALC